VPFTARNVAVDAVARDEVIVGFDRGRLKRLLGL
jgi:hypothetical protein